MFWGWTAQREHLRKIRESAVPFSEKQLATIRDLFIEHITEREAQRISDESSP